MKNHSENTSARRLTSQNAEELSPEELQERFANYIQEFAEEAKAGLPNAAIVAGGNRSLSLGAS